MGYRLWWTLCGMVVFAFPVVKCSQSNTMPNKELKGKPGSENNALSHAVALLRYEQFLMDAKQQEVQKAMAAMVSKTELMATKTELMATKNELMATKTELMDTKAMLTARLNARSGSTFVRWGKKTCPNNTTLIYTGITAGKYFLGNGSGTNYVCASDDPKFDSREKHVKYYGKLHGAEYERMEGHHDYTAACSLCLAPQFTTIMVPATYICPKGWTFQYRGHLVATDTSQSASTYVCLDLDPDNYSKGAQNKNQALLYYIVTICGSFPCPPFISKRVATCVVCSK